MGAGVEYRIVRPTGLWYWEVIQGGCEVVARGLADAKPAAMNKQVKQRKKRSWRRATNALQAAVT
jgi:hypothetical protein